MKSRNLKQALKNGFTVKHIHRSANNRVKIDLERGFNVVGSPLDKISFIYTRKYIIKTLPTYARMYGIK